MIVEIYGWQTPREIIEEDGKILFEVASVDGCSICQRRIRHVTEELQAKNLPVEFRTRQSFYGPSLYVVLDLPPEGVDPKMYVGDMLGIGIRQ